MHCSNCGTYLAPGVRFCSGCGSPAHDPEITRIARPLVGNALDYRRDEGDDDLEQVIFTVRPTLIFIKFGYALAVVAAIALVFLLALIPVPPYISILLGLRCADSCLPSSKAKHGSLHSDRRKSRDRTA